MRLTLGCKAPSKLLCPVFTGLSSLLKYGSDWNPFMFDPLEALIVYRVWHRHKQNKNRLRSVFMTEKARTCVRKSHALQTEPGQRQAIALQHTCRSCQCQLRPPIPTTKLRDVQLLFQHSHLEGHASAWNACKSDWLLTFINTR